MSFLIKKNIYYFTIIVFSLYLILHSFMKRRVVFS